VNNYSSYNASPMRKERAYAYKEIWRACAYWRNEVEVFWTPSM
jgi:hypothetical protein